MWNERSDHQCLALRGLRVEVRLGVNEAERAGPQPVSVEVELYRSGGAFAGRSLADCLDYDRVYRHLTERWPALPHTDLLEQLAEDAVRVCLEDGRVEACRVVIRKLEIYGGRAIPEIAVFRHRGVK